MTLPDPPRPESGRVASLDQFRGYTVAGMLLVNYMGGFQNTPPVIDHHNTYCSYADVIMPQFFFAVGYAYRLTFLKRAAAGLGAAVGHTFRRNLGLLLLGVIFYGLDGGVRSWSELQELGVQGFLLQAFQRNPFQTLVHIAITSIWVLPVIGQGTAIRLAFLIGSAIVHILLSQRFFLDWALDRPVIDGGQIAFLSWTTPILAGSFAYDLYARVGARRSLGPLAIWAVLVMAIGYGLACLGASTASDGSPVAGIATPPFVDPGIEVRDVNLWTMSQRTGSVTYLTFATGFSIAVFAMFVLLSDLNGIRVGLFRTFGRNALAVYLTHMLVFKTIRAYAPSDAPLWYALAASGLAGLITYLFMRHLEKDGVYLKL